MATYEIPKSAGTKFWIVRSAAGTPVVTNGRTGKDQVWIPGKNKKRAEALIRKLEAQDHDGKIFA